nr:MAG TPA: DNA directed RNA polymerase subunit [Caudoviricetes sp.]
MQKLQIKRSITDRSDTALNSYLKDINKIPMLSREEEIEVAKKAAKGDSKAKERLVTANLRFVVSCAKQYQGQGIPLIDLISEGNIGLQEAVNKFDVNKGFKFISYAVWWIRQAIMHALNEHSRLLRLPRSQILQLNQITKASKEFEQSNGRLPSTKELSDLVEIDESKVEQLLNLNIKPTSYDNPIGEESGTLIDLIPNQNIENTDATLFKESKQKEINSILNLLTDREHDILIMYFGLNGDSLTLYEIADKFGLTHERTRQIKNNAINKLQNKYNKQVKNIING